MPVHCVPLTSGTISTVRPSLRPRATSSSRSMATRRFVPWRCGLRSTRDGHAERDPAPVDDLDGGRTRRGVALDRVAGEADHRVDGRVERGQRAQRRVAEPLPRRAGRQDGLHERTVEQGLVRAGDADGDRLGLVLDGVDRPGQLLDAAGQRGGEVVDQAGRRADLAGLALVGLERRVAGDVAQPPDAAGPPCWPRGGRRRRRCAARRGSAGPAATAPRAARRAARRRPARPCPPPAR